MRVAARAGIGRARQLCLRGRIVERVVEPRQHAGGIAKGWMRRDVVDALAVDPDLAAVAETLEELLARERPCDPAAHTSSFQAAPAAFSGGRSEERRVGKEGRSRWPP